MGRNTLAYLSHEILVYKYQGFEDNSFLTGYISLVSIEMSQNFALTQTKIDTLGPLHQTSKAYPIIERERWVFK